MRVSSCPDPEKLVGYSVGRLSREQCAAVEDHLDSCQVCSSTILNLDDTHDGLIGAISCTVPTNKYENEPAYQLGLKRVNKIERIVDLPDDLASQPIEEISSPRKLREYELHELLGVGGMGSVYRAVHSKLQKVVAVKILPTERTNDLEAVARFEQEMKAVGAVDHANIVRATDAGEFEGVHFLVMEYVQGIDLSKLLHRLGRLSVADASQIVCEMALGLQEAHQHGLVHRDIKPANAMLTPSGQIKILDLGLALLRQDIGADQLTTHGQIMGTLDYMAPEQFVDTHCVDIRADIYSLGCTFFYLLTAQAPFNDKERTPYQKLNAHAELAPPPVTNQRPDVPGELAEILERMLAKKAVDRYSTPNDVIEVVSRFAVGSDLAALSADAAGKKDDSFRESETSNRVASAYVDTSVGESRPEVERSSPERKIVGKILSIAIAGLVIIATALVIIMNTGEGQLVFELNRNDVTVTIDGEEVEISSTGKDLTCVVLIGSGKHRVVVSKEGFDEKSVTVRVYRGREAVIDAELEAKLAPSEVRRFLGHLNSILGVDVSPDGKLLASASKDMTARIWDIETGSELHVLRGHDKYVRAVRFSPDNKQLLTASHDLSIRLWDVKSGKQIMRYAGHESVVTSVSFAPDGNQFVSGSFDGDIKLWKLSQATQVKTYGYADEPPKARTIDDLYDLEAHVAWVRHVEFSDDGKQFLSCGNEALTAIWNIADPGKITTRMVGHLAPVAQAVFVPESDSVVSVGFDNTIRLWNAVSGELIHSFAAQSAPVLSVDVSSDGHLAVTGGDDSTVRLWSLKIRQQLRVLKGHSKPVRGVAFSPDNEYVFSGSDDSDIRMWHVEEPQD